MLRSEGRCERPCHYYMKNPPEDTPLSARVEDKQIVIRFGIERVATMLLPRGYAVDNQPLFAEDVARAMTRDNDLGETPLDRFFCRMAKAAADDGSGGISKYPKK